MTSITSQTGGLADPAATTARLTIDLSAIVENWRTMRALSGEASCGAAVKGNAYGTGMAEAAVALAKAGCRQFFVADANEGAALRKLLPDAEIFILSGAFDAAMPLLVENRLTPVLNSLDQIAAWTSAGNDRPAALHIDTGMNRLGITPAEAVEIAENRAVEPTLVMSHFACADSPDHPLNAIQIERFAEVRGHFPEARASLANSAGIHMGDAAGFDLTRPGIALYGGECRNDLPNPMRPVAKAEARILTNRVAKAGETVSYGATVTLGRDTRIAICGIGYADGFHRSSSGSGVPLRREVQQAGMGAIEGRTVPLLGRVTMDLLMFDVTDLPETLGVSGQWIELFGETIPLDDAARAAGTIGYELLTSLGRRYARRYI
ncbi:alanine racemase [Pseudohoeflea suaedae]|uniref:Alanine racemase n=1 Tax=Pseudohoeflea suaedae TaxID=877384 RepID=A0A4R5PJQ7_9HYPH|nr:alanine racemase [Pseudohoeflea suaedae]TDH35917.1 alanine racemase [Pseudohoeflea suaedae]